MGSADFVVGAAVGEGSIWATDLHGYVQRIDPQTGPTLAPIWLDLRSVTGIAAGAGAVWVTDANSDSVVRIDPRTDTVSAPIRVGRSPKRVAAGADSVWVTSERDGTVTRIDPHTYDVETIDVGGIPTSLALGLGGAWATVDVR
jgi:virginiamycin B lyase